MPRNFAPQLLLVPLALVSLAGGARVARANPRVQHYSGNNRYATPCFVTGDQVGVVFDLPASEYPLQITRVGIDWDNRYAGEGVMVEKALRIYAGTLPSTGTLVYTQSFPPLTTGEFNTFAIDSTVAAIASGPFVVSLEFLNTNVGFLMGASVVSDGNGPTPGRNLVYTLDDGWEDTSTKAFTGNWRIYVEYRKVDCVTATGSAPVSFDGVEIAQTACTDLVVTNTGCDTLLISSITATGASEFAIDTTATQHTIAPGGATHIAACVTPATLDEISGTVTVASNATNSPTVMSLTCRPNCVTATGPGLTTFDGVGVAETACTELVLKNDGCDTLYVARISVTGASAFAVDTTVTERAIPPSGTARIAACVTPSGPGVATCAITVVSNAWNSPTVIDLSCEPAVTSTAVGDRPRALAITAIVPNPFNPNAAILFEMPSTDRVTAEIWSANGARVRTLAREETFAAGPARLQWDGRTDAGGTAASGVYFVRIRTHSASRVARMTLLK
jgi:hypothetical protein